MGRLSIYLHLGDFDGKFVGIDVPVPSVLGSADLVFLCLFVFALKTAIVLERYQLATKPPRNLLKLWQKVWEIHP